MYTRDSMIDYCRLNFLDVFNNLGKSEQGALLGCIAEVATIKERGAEGTDVSGSDMIEDELEKEIKSCWSYQQGYARWGNITSKLHKCDTFIFIDGVANIVYEVPHDVVFFEMSITPAAGGEIRTTRHNLEILERYKG